jgi:hypothetical protein
VPHRGSPAKSDRFLQKALGHRVDGIVGLVLSKK